jgi:medium-chain acyl-[acyl-carrier-protein] hydrolase
MLASFEISPVRAPLPSSKWLMCPRPDAAAPLRLWCVPFAGGGAAVWHPWAAQLAGLAELIAVRLPGRESRLSEAPFVRLLQIIPILVDLIAPFATEDYALCGHSFGGLVVFELTRALRARGLRLPQALIVSGVRAPHHGPDRPLLHQMPHRQFIAEVERRYGAIPTELRDHPEFLDLLLPILRADLEAYETYRYVPAPPLEMPLLALGGDRDANVSREQVFDWGAYTTGRFEAEMLPGAHFFVQDDVATTTSRVREFLGSITPPRSLERTEFRLPRQILER